MAGLQKAPSKEDEDSDYENRHDRSQHGFNGSLSSRQLRTSPRKKASSDEGLVYPQHGEESEVITLNLVPKTYVGSSKRGKQIRLSPLKCLKNSGKLHDLVLSKTPAFRPLASMNDTLPQRKLKAHVSRVAIGPDCMTQEISGGIEAVEAEIEESVWCGSDTPQIDSSDEDLPSPKKFLPRRNTKSTGIDFSSDLAKDLEGLRILDEDKIPTTLVLPSRAGSQSFTSRPSSSSDKENHEAVLHFSPPRLYSPSKQRAVRDTTPPPSPSKGKLQSPSKQRMRVPTPPHRPSIGAFWDPETVNDWNDQYSPRKEWKSPKKFGSLRDDASASPTSSLRKQSPTKRTKAETEAKKAWESRKHDLAESFLAELDQAITSSQIFKLTALTGGVKIIWSKTLKQTAGRANWRNEKIRMKHLDGSSSVINKHHASIELAEKVIDDEERLLNVLAHEFCHLCNFMISGVKDQPHGKQFKDWGRKASLAFADRGIEVTTKHSYAIEYRYIWRCSGEFCGAEFKRHSKSIDPLKQRCGSCKGGLVQIKPVPRKEASDGAAKVNGYAAFVKAHYALVKKEMQGSSQKEIMEAVARKYRAEKAKAADEKQSDFVEVDSETEVDHVARKLEFASLKDG